MQIISPSSSATNARQLLGRRKRPTQKKIRSKRRPEWDVVNVTREARVKSKDSSLCMLVSDSQARILRGIPTTSSNSRLYEDLLGYNREILQSPPDNSRGLYICRLVVSRSQALDIVVFPMTCNPVYFQLLT